MPFKSKAQLDHLKKHKPDVYKEFLSETKDVNKLPNRAKSKKQKSKKSQPNRKGR